jgi:glycosyltransferase involved in cell wall biosynthesis
MDDLPLVSIGMPVFNEGRFIERSLDALTTQNYKNIELLISDNASNDNTRQICQKYVEEYDWINYHKFNSNRGTAENFRYVLQETHGKYFMWASGHDLWSKNYISESVKLLESHQQVTVAVATTHWIDEVGMPYARKSGYTDTRGMDIIARYFTVLWGNMHPVLGLIHREHLMDCPQNYNVGGDLILLCRLALIGDFLHAPDAQLSRREFRDEVSYTDKLVRYKSKNFGLVTGRMNKKFPLVHLPIELIKGVLAAKITWKIKVSILFLLLPTLPVRYFSGSRKKSV